jgi:hypothetical protein
MSPCVVVGSDQRFKIIITCNLKVENGRSMFIQTFGRSLLDHKFHNLDNYNMIINDNMWTQGILRAYQGHILLVSEEITVLFL